MTHFGVRISKWELDVVAKMCLAPFGVTSASASLEAGLVWSWGGSWKRQRPLKTFDFVIPGTSTIAVKADEGGIQERTKGDWLQGAPNLRRELWCAMTNLGRTCWEVPWPNIDWKTSCIVMLLEPFPRARLGTAVGMVGLGKRAPTLWGAVDAA